MPRFLTRFLTGFIGALILATMAFGNTGGKMSRHIFDVLTAEKFPPFALQVVAVSVVAGIAWAFIDTWTHLPSKPKPHKPGDGVIWHALSRLVIGFAVAVLYVTSFVARGSAAPGHSREAIAAALTPAGFAPIAVPVLTISVLFALIWTAAGVLSYNSGTPGEARRAP